MAVVARFTDQLVTMEEEEIGELIRALAATYDVSLSQVMRDLARSAYPAVAKRYAEGEIVPAPRPRVSAKVLDAINPALIEIRRAKTQARSVLVPEQRSEEGMTGADR